MLWSWTINNLKVFSKSNMLQDHIWNAHSSRSMFAIFPRSSMLNKYILTHIWLIFCQIINGPGPYKVLIIQDHPGPLVRGQSITSAGDGLVWMEVCRLRRASKPIPTLRAEERCPYVVRYFPPGGYSTSVWVGMCGLKWGLRQRIGTKFEGLLNWFWQNVAWRTDFWPKLSWTGLTDYRLLDYRDWKFTKIRHFERKIGKRCVTFGHKHDKWGSCGTEKCWKGGFNLVERLREGETWGSLSPLNHASR